MESPSRVTEGPIVAVEALAAAFDNVLSRTGVPRARGARGRAGHARSGQRRRRHLVARARPTSSHPAWRSFDVRGALEERLGLPVVYNNDGNAAALYAHQSTSVPRRHARRRSSAIVGTGLGGGVIESGRVVTGAAGMAGELGHVHIPMQGLLDGDQPLPSCNCGFDGDAESVASLTGIEQQPAAVLADAVPDHPLAAEGSVATAAKLVRGLRRGGRPAGR